MRLGQRRRPVCVWCGWGPTSDARTQPQPSPRGPNVCLCLHVLQHVHFVCVSIHPVGDTGQLFAVMEPAVVYKVPPKVKGGPEMVPPPPVPATISFRLIKAEDNSVVKVHCVVPRAPAFLFGGPMLGVALVADAVAAVSGDVAGACNRRDGKASVNLQFYDWVPPPSTVKVWPRGPHVWACVT